MHTYNTNPPTDELTNAQNQLAQVKDIMVQNVEQILSRGERIELLVDKTDNMASQATEFRRGARTVRRQMWWKNTRILALSVVVAIVSISSPFSMILLLIPLSGSRLDHRRTVLRRWSQSVSLVIVKDNLYRYVSSFSRLPCVYYMCSISFSFVHNSILECNLCSMVHKTER